MINRNTAFTAMTRTKGWLCLTGVGRIAEDLFKEIEAVLAKPGVVTFKVPDMTKIQRNLETEVKTRKKKQGRKVEKVMDKLVGELLDADSEYISQERLSHAQPEPYSLDR